MSEDYTDQEKLFVEVYLEESIKDDDYHAVAKKAKIAAGYPDSRSIPSIIKKVKDLIVEGVNLQLAMMAPKLLNGIDSVMNDPARPGAKNLIAAASTGLDRAGIVKTEKVQVDVKAQESVLILPAKNKIE